MPNNPATRRAGASRQVAAANTIVRGSALASAVSDATSSAPVSTPAESAVDSAGGDLAGSYPNPTVAALHTGATKLTTGTITDGEFLKRVGATLVSANPLSGGISAIITTAKLTGGGANGSMTFVNGLLTVNAPAT